MKEKILIPFVAGCRVATFIKRYKRFTVEVLLEGEVVKVHTNNTGSMMGLLREGQDVYISPANNPNRKLKWTLEMVRIDSGWVGVNTQTPNKIIERIFDEKIIEEVVGYDSIKREAKVGDSRLDAHFRDSSGKNADLWVECKNVTLVEDCVACFPDSPTVRGQKHLQELMSLAAQGRRVAMFFFVQRGDGNCFGPADFIDLKYSELFIESLKAGVECWAYEATLSEKGIGVGRRLELSKYYDKKIQE